jgi:hypothetical protein
MDLLSSTQAELFGITTPEEFLDYFCKFYEIESTSKIVKCCDNQGAISRVNWTQNKFACP